MSIQRFVFDFFFISSLLSNSEAYCVLNSSTIMKYGYQREEYVVVSEGILKEMAKTLSERYKMRTIGTTAGLADCVNVLGLSFQINGPLNQEELRKILVDCVEEFLVTINTNERLQTHLKTVPFTDKGIEITIFIKDSKGDKVYDPEIAIAKAGDGYLQFLTDERGNRGPFTLLHKETYQEAKALVGR